MGKGRFWKWRQEGVLLWVLVMVDQRWGCGGNGNDFACASYNDFPQVIMSPDRTKEEKESEWLRVSLHKWLDDEYCPEPTNVDISRVAANSYYQSLLQKTTDLGEILLKMVRELESISYQESFHGAFSSANAAVNLIAERIDNV
uniref:Uncharacterized protein n=1 Tax=Chenopodium quinoa TaxID=63459 RepID=A0A803MSR2_CHEQI